MNFTYILKCSDGTYYTGWTNDLDRRMKAHNKGNGGKYTRSRRPVELIYYETFDTKQEAMSREFAIKQLTRLQKEQLIMKNGGKQNTSAACGGRHPQAGIQRGKQNTSAAAGMDIKDLEREDLI